MSLKTMRREKGWSQEQLAEISGVSIRTIQRLEAGEAAGLETQKALAAAFEITVSEFNQQLSETPQPVPTQNTKTESDAMTNNIARYGWKGFLYHLGAMMGVITWLFFLAGQFDFPGSAVIWVLFIWVFALLGHAVTLASMDELVSTDELASSDE